MLQRRAHVHPFFLEWRSVHWLAYPKWALARTCAQSLESPPLAAADVKYADEYRLGLHDDDLLGCLLDLWLWERRYLLHDLPTGPWE